MDVLIIEDHVFNAFCLRNVLESVIPFVKTTIIKNAQEALAYSTLHKPDLIITDGDLGDPSNITGPQIADSFLKRDNKFTIIGWSDSEGMREAFTDVFAKHGRVTNHFNFWSKAIRIEQVTASIEYYFGDMPRVSQKLSAY